MEKKSYKDQVVWIIGASSGIGYALAKELAASGAQLVLSARRKDELEKIKAEIGVEHLIFQLDVSDSEMTLRTAQAIRAAKQRIDRVIFMAAVYTPMQLDELDTTITRNIIDVNLLGAFNVVSAVVPLFNEQKFGQIALCGSVAGYVGMPNAQPYSATKAGIINLAESLHNECSNNIDVKLISPGFVRTPLTDKNKFPMPMIVEPEIAAKIIAQDLLTGKFEIHFPPKFTMMIKFLRLLPYPLQFWITGKLK